MTTDAFSFPQVALDFMNRDHADFVRHCREILALAAAATDHATLGGRLDELLHHTREHFAQEEQAMRDSGFPPYPMHKGEHDRVLADMSAQLDRWRADKDNATLAAWIEGPVAEWFSAHVASMDFVTAQFAARALGHA